MTLSRQSRVGRRQSSVVGQWLAIIGRLCWRAGLLAVCVSVAAGACSRRRDPIIIGEGMLIVENQTSSEWRNVLITVNHHYRGGAPVLAPGGRLNAPLRDFETGYGQRFDRGRMSVFRVVVTAKDKDGKDVTLQWGN